MMLSPMSLSPRFAAVTLEVGKPLPFVTYEVPQAEGKPVVHKVQQKQMAREMTAVTIIIQKWLNDRKDEIEKATAGFNIKLKLMNGEDYDAQYTNAHQRKLGRTIAVNDPATAAKIGIQAFMVDAQGGEKRMRGSNPGNNPDGPFFPQHFQEWAENFIIKPDSMFNSLTRILKQGIYNATH